MQAVSAGYSGLQQTQWPLREVQQHLDTSTEGHFHFKVLQNDWSSSYRIWSVIIVQKANINELKMVPSRWRYYVPARRRNHYANAFMLSDIQAAKRTPNGDD